MPDPSTPDPTRDDRPARRGLPAWRWALLAASILVMAAGLILPIVAGGDPDPARAARVPSTALGLTGDAPAASAAEPDSTLAAWSPAIFRMGFSFFVGFAIAFALRAFFGFAIAALGFFFLALFGLQYSGLIEVKWAMLEQRYDAITGAVTTEARSMASAAARYLPSAGTAAAGFVAGWWRRR